ncbi:phage late control D family protein [Amorphus sp. MBR-141]
MTPAARIVLGGIDITANLLPKPFGIPLLGGGVAITAGALGSRDCPLLSIRTEDNEGLKQDSASLSVDNRSGYGAPQEGTRMQVWLGYAGSDGGAGGLAYMGAYYTGQWTKSGRPKLMEVSAHAVDPTSGAKEPRSTSYHEMTVGDIVGKIAGRRGLDAKVHPSIASIRIGHIDQSSESDISFLSRLAKRIGANFKVANDTLILNEISPSLPGGGDVPVFTITETGQTDWRSTGSERGNYGGATASFQNVETGEREWVKVGSGDTVYRDRKVYKTEEEARQAATGQLSALQRGKILTTISMLGEVTYFAGARADLVAFDPDIDGLHVIKSVSRTLDAGGFKQSISLESVSDE